MERTWRDCLRGQCGALHLTPLAEAVLHRHRARSEAAAFKRHDYSIRLLIRAAPARFDPWRTGHPPTEHARTGKLGVVVCAANAEYGFCHAAERRAEPSVCTGRFQDDLERHHFRDWVRKVTSLSDPDPKSLCSVSFTVPTRARSSQKGPSFSWAHPPARPQGPCVEGKVVVVCFSFRCRAFFSGDVLWRHQPSGGPSL